LEHLFLKALRIITFFDKAAGQISNGPEFANSQIVGIPRAMAICNGHESLVTNRSIDPITSINSLRLVSSTNEYIPSDLLIFFSSCASLSLFEFEFHTKNIFHLFLSWEMS
jgi:hypothetical protein